VDASNFSITQVIDKQKSERGPMEKKIASLKPQRWIVEIGTQFHDKSRSDLCGQGLVTSLDA